MCIRDRITPSIHVRLFLQISLFLASCKPEASVIPVTLLQTSFRHLIVYVLDPWSPASTVYLEPNLTNCSSLVHLVSFSKCVSDAVVEEISLNLFSSKHVCYCSYIIFFLFLFLSLIVFYAYFLITQSICRNIIGWLRIISKKSRKLSEHIRITR